MQFVGGGGGARSFFLFSLFLHVLLCALNNPAWWKLSSNSKATFNLASYLPLLSKCLWAETEVNSIWLPLAKELFLGKLQPSWNSFSDCLIKSSFNSSFFVFLLPHLIFAIVWIFRKPFWGAVCILMPHKADTLHKANTGSWVNYAVKSD